MPPTKFTLRRTRLWVPVSVIQTVFLVGSKPRTSPDIFSKTTLLQSSGGEGHGSDGEIEILFLVVTTKFEESPGI